MSRPLFRKCFFNLQNVRISLDEFQVSFQLYVSLKLADNFAQGWWGKALLFLSICSMKTGLRKQNGPMVGTASWRGNRNVLYHPCRVQIRQHSPGRPHVPDFAKSTAAKKGAVPVPHVTCEYDCACGVVIPKVWQQR